MSPCGSLPWAASCSRPTTTPGSRPRRSTTSTCSGPRQHSGGSRVRMELSSAPVTHTGRVSASPVETIKQRQREWAARTGHTLTDKGYCGCDDDNIHRGLSESARREFAAANGSELGGKILATHSSSALACNWFDYWRERDFGILSEAFGVARPFVSLRLEAKLPTGMRGADANLH